MKSWKDMNAEEQKALMKNTMQVITASGVDGISVSINGEYVCNIAEGAKENKSVIKVSGTMKKSEEAKKDELVQQIKTGSNCSDMQINIKCKIAKGDKMGVIKGAEKICKAGVFEEGIADIEHKEGEVILLDLWATWCPPCQNPMNHNQEMLAKGKDNWADKVRIVGLGTDQGIDALKKRIEEKAWTKVEHYWVSNGCSASADFGAGGIPHCILVDTTGTIVWTGHPASINLEETIDTLLTGKNPFDQPEGQQPAGRNDGPPMGDISGTDGSAFEAKYHAVVDELLANEDLKKNAQGMQCFFVLVSNGQFSAEADDIKWNYQMHTIAARGDNQACKDTLKNSTESIRAEAAAMKIMCRDMF